MKTGSQLQRDVLDELKWWPSLNAAHIGVAAEKGVVTLTGEVTHCAEKAADEDGTTGVCGVKDTGNDIMIELAGYRERSDQDEVTASINAMKSYFEVPEGNVEVVVKYSWVTLEGTVDCQYQKDAAERCVRYLTGVTAVTKNIAIKPSAKWIDVKMKIENAFRRNADIEARSITVSLRDCKVTLSSNVASWAESVEAVSVACGHPALRRSTTTSWSCPEAFVSWQTHP